jgi:hypothetical protein
MEGDIVAESVVVVESETTVATVERAGAEAGTIAAALRGAFLLNLSVRFLSPRTMLTSMGDRGAPRRRDRSFSIDEPTTECPSTVVMRSFTRIPASFAAPVSVSAFTRKPPWGDGSTVAPIPVGDTFDGGLDIAAGIIDHEEMAAALFISSRATYLHVAGGRPMRLLPALTTKCREIGCFSNLGDSHQVWTLERRKPQSSA